MVIDNKFEIGNTVYLVTDIDQFPRLVTGFLVRKYDIMYELSSGQFCSNHMDFEITQEKDYAKL